MKETIEFRISERKAQGYLRPEEGRVLGGSVRKIVLPVADPRVQYIAKIDRELRQEGNAFFASWFITRQYEQSELSKAELFKMIISKVFEPAGEECGTLYDENIACLRCGLNRKQMGDLILDLRKISKRIDIAKTIAGEVIVSACFVETWQKAGLKGASFRQVMQKGRKTVVAEGWYQISSTSNPLEVVAPTRAGNDPFDDDSEGRYKCSGHVIGLNLISELTAARDSYDGSDLVATDQAFGWKQGLLMPETPLIISHNAWDRLGKAGIKGYTVEIVQLV